MGAEIVKIEDAGPNTNERSWPPFAPGTEESTYFIGLNRGKRSIELNLREPTAREIFYNFVSQADFVLENFAPGVADKLSVGYEDCKKVKPDIKFIYPSRHLGNMDLIASFPAMICLPGHGGFNEYYWLSRYAIKGRIIDR